MKMEKMKQKRKFEIRMVQKSLNYKSFKKDGGIAVIKKVNLKNNQPKPLRKIVPYEDLLVWGKCKGFGWLPGRIANRGELNGPIDSPDDPSRWIKWFEDGKYTDTHIDNIAVFHEFKKFFRQNVYNRKIAYKLSVDKAIQEAARRSGKKLMNEQDGIKWALNDFLPDGCVKFLPNKIKGNMDKDQCYESIQNSYLSFSEQEQAETKNKTLRTPKETEKELMDQRNNMLLKVLQKLLNIEQLCLGCGSLDIHTKHPLFRGGLCRDCKVDFIENSYMFDNAGYGCYCSICSAGDTIILCDNTNCGRSFCTSCLQAFLTKDESNKEISQKFWKCFLCRNRSENGLLVRREEWQRSFYDMICHSDEIEKVVSIVPKYFPKNCVEKEAVRVLSLFDGIGTGCVALKEIGLKISSYYASEVDPDAIAVVQVRHPEVIHIGDIRQLTIEKLMELGPFDLLIGGSPCNELSIVNPKRKGIWSDSGSGHLFFEYFRIQQTCQVMASERKMPFFWLFENVVCMDTSTRETITHFFQRPPVLLDAKHVSPSRRPRMFWGNLPGMTRLLVEFTPENPEYVVKNTTKPLSYHYNLTRMLEWDFRPLVASPNDRLNLQDCLENGRKAISMKINTITTKLNTTRNMAFAQPVHDNNVIACGYQLTDNLWSSEIERIFGFPEHYTDVNNMARASRQRVLGKAWSVPVIKHLLAPLKDYFSHDVL